MDDAHPLKIDAKVMFEYCRSFEVTVWGEVSIAEDDAARGVLKEWWELYTGRE